MILQYQFYNNLIFILFGFRKTKLLIKLPGGVISLNIAENNPPLFSVLLHGLQHHPDCCPAISLPLIALINKKLTQIITFQLRQIVIHAHSHRKLIVINNKCAASVIPIGIGPRQYTCSVSHIGFLGLPNLQSQTPVIRINIC